MMARRRKIGIMSVFAIVIALASGRANAFPLVWSDVERLGTEVLNGIQQVSQIKNEIDSNMALIKEAQERGYAAAANDLIGKIQNGDLDRFGNELGGLGDTAFNATHGAKAVQERNAQREEAAKKAAENAANGENNEVFGKKIYNWLKDNRSTTDAGFNTFNNIQNGDVASALRNATGGAESALGDNVQGLGTIGSMGGAATDIINNSGNVGEAVANTANNGELRGAVNSIPSKDNSGGGAN